MGIIVAIKSKHFVLLQNFIIAGNFLKTGLNK